MPTPVHPKGSQTRSVGVSLTDQLRDDVKAAGKPQGLGLAAFFRQAARYAIAEGLILGPEEQALLPWQRKAIKARETETPRPTFDELAKRHRKSRQCVAEVYARHERRRDQAEGKG